MTLAEFEKNIKKELRQLHNVDALLLAIARDVYRQQVKRIFTEGELSNGSKLKYTASPILVGASSFATKKGVNAIFGSKKKRSEQKWVTTKKGKRLVELKGGFKKVKELSGRPNPFDFTGQLKKSFSYEGLRGEAVIGFKDVKRLTPNGKATKTKNEDVRKGLEDQKGLIFQMTEKEEQSIDKNIDIFLEQILNVKTI